MDRRGSWDCIDEKLVQQRREARISGKQLQLITFSDGGKRASGGEAAAAWVLADTSKKIIAMKGIHLGNAMEICSSTAELVALESVAQFAVAYL